MALPPLREELALLPGPVLADGQKSQTLHDPSRNLYFQLDWPSFEVLKRWGMDDAEKIAGSVTAETTLHLGAEDVVAVAKFLDQNQLLQPLPGQAGEFSRRTHMLRGSLGKWLLHNYLFFRIPLVKPDPWLSRWAGHLGAFYRRPFWYCTAAVLAFGLLEIYRDWDRFSTTLTDSFSITGLFSYGVALTFVKLLHELGHAVTAKRFGCRIPTMGVAFLVMWPVAYTDTNDVWRLTSRRQRLLVAAAGVWVELTIAASATLAWVLLPEGMAKTLAFMLAMVTWVSSVAINASPFMRFDGYFLLADWLGMPNLHARSFALARWDLRERLFGLGDDAPEVLPRRRRAGLILFAYATWLYRLVIFLGIAALVYAFFIKAVGILLFLVEIIWFVLLPPYRELLVWKQRWPALRTSTRARRSALVAAGLILLLLIPMPNHISSSGLLRPERQFVVYAPAHARIQAIAVGEGQRVASGAVLFAFDSPELTTRRRAAEAKRDSLRWKTAASTFDSEQRGQCQVLQQQLEAAEAELSGVQADAKRYAPVAPFPGVLRDIDPDLRQGNWVSQNEPLARLVDDKSVQVVTFLSEEEVSLVAPKDAARFYADGLEGPVLLLQVLRIDPDASATLSEGELSSPYGGSIAVRERKGVLYPEQAIYRVTLKVLDPLGELAGHSWRGKVVISGSWSAPAWRFVRSALSLFWREAGF